MARTGPFIPHRPWKGVGGFLLFFSATPSGGIIIRGSILRGTSSKLGNQILPSWSRRKAHGGFRYQQIPYLSFGGILGPAHFSRLVFQSSSHSVNLKLLLMNFF